MNTDAEGDRTPVVAFHAWLISAVVVGAPLVLGFASLLSRSERIKEVALRDTVLIMGAAGIVVATLIVSSIARPVFARACEKLDRSGACHARVHDCFGTRCSSRFRPLGSSWSPFSPSSG